jgi:hypothetical protein
MERKIKFSRQRRISFLTIMAVSCLFIAFVSPAIAEWQNGNGDIYYQFNGNLSVWDLSGSYSGDIAAGLGLSYVITQDAAGKITGSGNASVSMGSDSIDMSFDIKGAITQKNGVAAIKLNFKGKGTALVEGESYKFTFSEKVNATVDASSNTISGNVVVRISMQGESYSETVPFDESLPANMDGSATFSLNCTSNGKNVSGTGTLTLSNDEIYNFGVKGKYNAKSDESNLTLKGGAKGASLKLKVDGSDGTIKTLKGKVLGQKLTATNIAP